MCGVYGIASNVRLDDNLGQKFSNLGSELSHRGPDGSAELLNEKQFMGFTRLAIVDVDRGMQPFFSEDGSIMVTANGQIYNYLELREELLSQGHVFTSECDIEIIPHLYEVYGDSFVSRIKGMFAIALVDHRTDELKLYVDSLGEKPIYWAMQENYFVYSSELVPLLKVNLAKMVLNRDQIPNYIKYGFVPDPFTIIEGVYRVRGGTYLTFSVLSGSLTQTKYWNLFESIGSITNPVSRMKDVLEEIGKTIVQGEAKIGIALSSGRDSRLVAKITAPHVDSLSSFSLGYTEDSRHDESHAASVIAKELGLVHEAVRISPSEAAQLLAQVCAVVDEPIADITSVNYFKLFQHSKSSGIRVLLMGHGADEAFFGYEWTLQAIERARARKTTLLGDFQIKLYWKLFRIPLVRLHTLSIYQLREMFLYNIAVLKQIHLDLKDYRQGETSIDFYQYKLGFRKREKFAKNLQKSLGVGLGMDRVYESSSSLDLVRGLQHQMLSDYLRVNGFLQIDKLSMSQSIEVRNPLADVRLLDLFRASNWDPLCTPTKALLRASSETLNEIENHDYLKKGFSPPRRVWFRAINERYAKELSCPRLVDIGVIPKRNQKDFSRPFDWNFQISEIWFPLVFLELWVREVEQLVGEKFNSQKFHTESTDEQRK
jgi:asparagine synthase (glutamine-hydrolysing)